MNFFLVKWIFLNTYKFLTKISWKYTNLTYGCFLYTCIYLLYISVQAGGQILYSYKGKEIFFYNVFRHKGKEINSTLTGLKLSAVGCPRNNQFFFRFEPKQTETQSVSVVFWFVSRNQKIIFSVCFGASDQYRNNRNKPKKPLNNALY